MPLEKWQVAQIWRAYQNREGPNNLGAVQWPRPKAGCLAGLKFLSTGVYETIERDDLYDLLKGCGARVYSGMSKNLDYLLVGRDAGPVKLQNASDWGINQLSEEDFFNFITEKINTYDPATAPPPVKAKAAPKPKVQPVKKEAKPKVQHVKKESQAVKQEVKPKAEKKPRVKKEPQVKEEPGVTATTRRKRTSKPKPTFEYQVTPASLKKRGRKIKGENGVAGGDSAIIKEVKKRGRPKKEVSSTGGGDPDAAVIKEVKKRGRAKNTAS